MYIVICMYAADITQEQAVTEGGDMFSPSPCKYHNITPYLITISEIRVSFSSKTQLSRSSTVSSSLCCPEEKLIYEDCVCLSKSTCLSCINKALNPISSNSNKKWSTTQKVLQKVTILYLNSIQSSTVIIWKNCTSNLTIILSCF